MGGGGAWTSPGDEPANTHRESLEHSLLAYSKYGDRYTHTTRWTPLDTSVWASNEGFAHTISTNIL